MFLRRRETPEQILCVQRLKARFGELTAALGGVNLLPRQLIEPRSGTGIAVSWMKSYFAYYLCLLSVKI